MSFLLTRVVSRSLVRRLSTTPPHPPFPSQFFKSTKPTLLPPTLSEEQFRSGFQKGAAYGFHQGFQGARASSDFLQFQLRDLVFMLLGLLAVGVPVIFYDDKANWELVKEIKGDLRELRRERQAQSKKAIALLEWITLKIEREGEEEEGAGGSKKKAAEGGG